MISGKLFRQVLDKFLKSPVSQNARVQVVLPNGQFYDIKGIQLMENKLIGVRESHRLVIVKPLASRDWKLYEGKDVLELDARGLLLEARCSGLEACCSWLETLA
jgi:hypothetical protein